MVNINTPLLELLLCVIGGGKDKILVSAMKWSPSVHSLTCSGVCVSVCVRECVCVERIKQTRTVHAPNHYTIILLAPQLKARAISTVNFNQLLGHYNTNQISN